MRTGVDDINLAVQAGTRFADIISGNNRFIETDRQLSPESIALANRAVEINGLGGDDVIYGGLQADQLFGGMGDDTIYSFGTQGLFERIEAGAGDDEVHAGMVRASDPSSRNFYNANGGDGSDLFDFALASRGVVLRYDRSDDEVLGFEKGVPGAPVENDALDDAPEDFLLIDFERFGGAQANDAFFLNAAVQGFEVHARGGDDSVLGGTSADSLYGDAGNDAIDAGRGRDTVFGGADTDVLSGREGNDSLAGGSGLDTLTGGSGADTLTGGTGNDDLTADAGFDLLIGEAGDDILRGNSGDDSLIGGAGTDLLLGGNNNDTLLGGNNNDTLEGGNQRDSLDGGAGAEILLGGRGDDTMIGGLGNDTLNGQRGNDDLTGDGGADVFRFRVNAGDDVIIDFGLGADTLELDDALWPGTLSAADVLDMFGEMTNAGLRLRFEGGESIMLAGFFDETSLVGMIDIA